MTSFLGIRSGCACAHAHVHVPTNKAAASGTITRRKDLQIIMVAQFRPLASGIELAGALTSICNSASGWLDLPFRFPELDLHAGRIDKPGEPPVGIAVVAAENLDTVFFQPCDHA